MMANRIPTFPAAPIDGREGKKTCKCTMMFLRNVKKSEEAHNITAVGEGGRIKECS